MISTMDRQVIGVKDLAKRLDEKGRELMEEAQRGCGAERQRHCKLGDSFLRVATSIRLATSKPALDRLLTTAFGLAYKSGDGDLATLIRGWASE